MRVPFITILNYRCAVTQGAFSVAYELSPVLCRLPRPVTEGAMLSRSSGHRQIVGSRVCVCGGAGGASRGTCSKDFEMLCVQGAIYGL